MQGSLYPTLDEWCSQSTRANWAIPLEKSHKLSLLSGERLPRRKDAKKKGVEVKKDPKGHFRMKTKQC